MKKTAPKYEAGDKVAFMGNQWEVRTVFNGIATIVRNGMSRPVKVEKLRRI